MGRYRKYFKILLIISSVFLVLSVSGAVIVRRPPEETKVRVPLVNWEHTGKFDYLAYLKPSYLFGPEPQPVPPAPPPTPPLSDIKYPATMVDRFKFNFAYRLTSEPLAVNITQQIAVNAIIMNDDGKSVAVSLLPAQTAKGGVANVTFELPISDNISGRDINIDILVYPVIETKDGPVFESFHQTLPILLKDGIYEIAREGLTHNETGYYGVLSFLQEGKLNYSVFLKDKTAIAGPAPSPVLEPPGTPASLSGMKYPVAMVDRFKFNFAYRLTAEPPAGNIVQQIAVNITGKNIDGKPVNISMPTTARGRVANVTFELPISNNILGGDIDIDIIVYPVIETKDGPVFELFRHMLTIQSKDGIFEIDREGLAHNETGYHGVFSFLQEGKLNYSVFLKATSPYGAVELSPPLIPSPPKPPTPPKYNVTELKPPPVPALPELKPVPAPPAKTLGSGEVLILKLIDRIEASFAYQLKADKPLKDLNEEVTVVAVLNGGETWRKTLVITPATKKEGNFSIAFPIDLAEINRMFETIRAETGVGGDNLTIRAEVRVTAKTDFGPIDEVFSQTLTSPVGRETLAWTDNLSKSKTGSIETTRVVIKNHEYLGLPISSASQLTKVLSYVFLTFLVFSLVLFLKFKPEKPSPIEVAALQISKKYKERIIEAVERTRSVSEKVVSLFTIEDLLKVADELGKPIIHQSYEASTKRHDYCVLDGDTSYRYTLDDNDARQSPAESDKEPKRAMEPEEARDSHLKTAEAEREAKEAVADVINEPEMSAQKEAVKTPEAARELARRRVEEAKKAKKV